MVNKKQYKKQYTVISTFAGGGGSSLGYKMAGFKELLAIEIDSNAVKTLKLNFDFPIWQKDIMTVDAEEILNFCNIKKGELDILDGSPPCQGFSMAGKRIISDERNDLFKGFVNLIIGLEPKVFVMENVSGMIKGKMKGKFNEILKTLKALNYNVKVKLMNAKYYNVPQSRERLIFIGVHKNLNIEPCFPKAINKIITVKQAWENLPEQSDEIKELDLHGFALLKKLEKMKPGQCIADIKGQTSGFTTVRIRYERPSPTITKSMEHKSAHNGLIHPIEHRKLTLTELKRLQTFPDNFKFTDWKNGWLRIGNSVAPNMMKAIAENIKVNILNKINYGKTD